MQVHRSELRSGAALLAALLIAATVTGEVAAAPRGSSGTAATSRSAAPARMKPAIKTSDHRFQIRQRINVRRLANQKPTGSSRGQLPFLTRPKPRNGSSGGKKPLVVGPPPVPTDATTNSDAPAALTPFIGYSSATNADTAGEPPDPWVAVGPDHVVQAVNLSFRMTDRQGGDPIDQSMFSFFGLIAGMGNSDPHIIYDSLHGRWLATEVSWDCDTSGGDVSFGHGYIDLAVSETTDPTGFWDVGFFMYSDQLPDYPAPGTSSDKIGLASNVYDMTAGPDCISGLAFDSGDLLLMDWADVLNGGALALDEWGSATWFTPRVGVQVPATSGTLHIVLVYDAGAGETNVAYLSYIGSVSAGTSGFDAAWDLTGDGLVSAFADPTQPVQGGSDTIAEAIDLRPTDAIWQDNRFVFVSTYPCGTSPRDCVRVTELDTSGASSVVRPSATQDFLVSEGGKDLFMGGVGLTGDGTLHLGWTRSSNGDDPSSYAAHQALGDALNSISAPELLAAGSGAYAGERWGDYVGIAQDPQVASQAWNANEYSGGTGWLTKVTPLRTAATTYVPIAPVRSLDTRPGGVGLAGMFAVNVPRTWQVSNGTTIPNEAVAVTGNLTVTGQQAAGYVSLTVAPTATPPTSTINFPLGQTRANNVTIPLSSTGMLSAVYKGKAGKKTHLLFDVTGYFLADDSGATFTPIATPIRILDTRPGGTGLSGRFKANTPRTLLVGDDVSVPSTAVAITGNLTVTGATTGGFVSVTKDPTASPTTSTINFSAGATRANGIFAPLNASHQLSIVYRSAAGARTHIILDVTGYFVAGTGGLRFVPLNPSRIMDSRPSAVLSGLSGVFNANTPQTLDVDGHWGVPVGAESVTGNLTVTGQTAGGYVSVTPDPTASPPTSTINFPLGDTLANGLVAPLSGTGNSSFVFKAGAGRKTHLILDLSGYFQ